MIVFVGFQNLLTGKIIKYFYKLNKYFNMNTDVIIYLNDNNFKNKNVILIIFIYKEQVLKRIFINFDLK